MLYFAAAGCADCADTLLTLTYIANLQSTLLIYYTLVAWLHVLKRLVPGGVQRKPYIESASLQLYGIQDEETGKCITTTTKSDSVLSTTAALSMALLNVEHFGCQLGI